jgi:hypothetical protein
MPCVHWVRDSSVSLSNDLGSKRIPCSTLPRFRSIVIADFNDKLAITSPNTPLSTCGAIPCPGSYLLIMILSGSGRPNASARPVRMAGTSVITSLNRLV